MEATRRRGLSEYINRAVAVRPSYDEPDDGFCIVVADEYSGRNAAASEPSATPASNGALVCRDLHSEAEVPRGAPVLNHDHALVVCQVQTTAGATTTGAVLVGTPIAHAEVPAAVRRRA